MKRLKWKLVFILSDIVLILKQIGARFALNVPWAQKLFWTHLMGHLGDVGHVGSHFFLFGDSVSVGARLVHGLRQTYHRLRNHFGDSVSVGAR